MYVSIGGVGALSAAVSIVGLDLCVCVAEARKAWEAEWEM